MSLINDALKKAQPKRLGSNPSPALAQMPEVPHHEPPKRKRRYLWGFLMAVIIVGLFSALVTAFLVHMILGDQAGTTAATTQQTPVTPETEQVWEKLPAEAEASNPATQDQPAMVAASEAATPENPAQPAQAAQEQPEPEGVKPVLKPTSKPNPAVWARLQELEIRGIMSGGNKVLIFDLSTGKTKSYEPGDILDGSLALTIASIETDEILFEDYGGSIHSKSF